MKRAHKVETKEAIIGIRLADSWVTKSLSPWDVVFIDMEEKNKEGNITTKPTLERSLCFR
jgi:hypothetical protein